MTSRCSGGHLEGLRRTGGGGLEELARIVSITHSLPRSPLLPERSRGDCRMWQQELQGAVGGAIAAMGGLCRRSSCGSTELLGYHLL